eukprot:SAG11_NODE_39615_length_227_cov_10.945312_1_plen_67_part_01
MFNVGAKRRRFEVAGLGAASIFAQLDGPGRKGACPGPPKTNFAGAQLLHFCCAISASEAQNASLTKE